MKQKILHFKRLLFDELFHVTPSVRDLGMIYFAISTNLHLIPILPGYLYKTNTLSKLSKQFTLPETMTRSDRTGLTMEYERLVGIYGISGGRSLYEIGCQIHFMVNTRLLYVLGPIDNSSALVQIIAWRRSCDKLLSEPMMVELPTHNASLGLNELNGTIRIIARSFLWLVTK